MQKTVKMQNIHFENLAFNRLSNVRDPLKLSDGSKVYFEIAYHYGFKKYCLEICTEVAHKATTGIILFFNSANDARDWIQRTYNTKATATNL